MGGEQRTLSALLEHILEVKENVTPFGNKLPRTLEPATKPFHRQKPHIMPRLGVFYTRIPQSNYQKEVLHGRLRLDESGL